MSDQDEKDNLTRIGSAVLEEVQDAVRTVVDANIPNSLEDIFNKHQHKIYHYFSKKCCAKCNDKNPLFRNKTILTRSQMEIVYEKSKKQKHSKKNLSFCCSTAIPGTDSKKFDLSFLNAFLNIFPEIIYWPSCLSNQNKSLQDLLNDNKHKLYHLYDKQPCCYCSTVNQLSADDFEITKNQFEELFDKQVSVSCKHTRGHGDCICVFSAKNLNEGLLGDWLTYVILRSCCPLMQCVDALKEVRNKVLGHCSTSKMSNEVFKEKWEIIEKKVPELLKHGIFDTEKKEADVEEFTKRLKFQRTKQLTADLQRQVMQNLLQQNEYVKELSESMQNFQSVAEKIQADVSKLQSLPATTERTEKIMTELLNARKNNPAQSFTSLSHRNYTEYSICVYPKQLKLKLKELYKDNDCGTGEAEKRLKENCHYLNLTFRNETPRDGNCFFDAVSSQLKDLGLRERSAEEIRKNVIDYLMKNPQFQGVDGVVNIEHCIDDSEFKDWTRSMGTNGVFADHVVVLGMAKMLKTNMLIVTSIPQANPKSCMIYIVGKMDSVEMPIILGHVWENHYYSLISLDATRENDKLVDNNTEWCKIQSRLLGIFTTALKEMEFDTFPITGADIYVTHKGRTVMREMRIEGKGEEFVPDVREIEIPCSSSKSPMSYDNGDGDSDCEDGDCFGCGKCKKSFTTYKSLITHKKECNPRKRKNIKKPTDTLGISSEQKRNKPPGEPNEKRLRLKICMEQTSGEMKPGWKQYVKRVQKMCTGNLDVDEDIIVEHIEDGSLVFWTKTNASTVKNKTKFAESMDRFMVNLFQKCPIDIEDATKFSFSVDVVETSEDEDNDDEDENDVFICGRCGITLKSFSSFTSHKRNCNISYKKQQHMDDCGKAQRKLDHNTKFEFDAMPYFTEDECRSQGAEAVERRDERSVDHKEQTDIKTGATGSKQTFRQDGYAYDIFVLHSEHDGEHVNEMIEMIKEKVALPDVKIASVGEDIPPGSNLFDAFYYLIDASCSLLLFITPHFYTDCWSYFRWASQLAHKMGDEIGLIPVLYEEKTIRPELREVGHLKPAIFFKEKDGDQYKSFIRKITYAIQQSREKGNK